MKNDPSTRNTMIFFACAMVVLFAYETFVMGPAERRKEAEAKASASLQQKLHPGVPLAPGSAPQAVYMSRDKAIGASPRLAIDTPTLRGSIALKGGRIDDLDLKNYRETLSRNSANVELFRPEGSQGAYFSQTGWIAQGVAGLPDANTVWTAPAGAKLTPSTPVTLNYTAPNGLMFTRTVAVDDKSMFTIVDQVMNHGTAPVGLAGYASVQRQCPALDEHHKDPCLADGAVRVNAHEGAIGWLGGKLQMQKYKDWIKKAPDPVSSTGGWLGITDKYWMAALAPPQGQTFSGGFRVTPEVGFNVFEANYAGPLQTVAPGGAANVTTHLFAGAKIVPLLQTYQKQLAIPEFDQAVDWGMFWFLTRPLFVVVEFFYKLVGNFGIAILLLTISTRLLFFPLANRAYESMTRMKKLQPQLEQLKKRFEKEPQKYQQEMMALYQREKINPFGGCMPMLLQIPVFFALYKVLSVTIEMRQAPFYGWVHDLSARDPTTLFNLFGLIPYDPSLLPGFVGAILAGPLHIGVWPLLYVMTMWLSMQMSPTTGMDPSQQAIMRLMPLIFMFTISGVAVGLVIYWAWSNVLSILQQYVIMHRLKVDNPIDSFITRISGKKQVAT